MTDASAMGYTTTAAATGAWTCPMLLPTAAPADTVQGILADLAASAGWPVNAFLHHHGGLVDEVVLYRDPSHTHGTPNIPECEAAMWHLVGVPEWTAIPDYEPTGGVLVGLGLREGYALDAPVHDPSVVHRHLAATSTRWTCRTATLFSARLVVDGQVRRYDEPGVVIHATGAGAVPAIEAAAGELAQDRFVVTDFDTRTTTAYARPT